MPAIARFALVAVVTISACAPSRRPSTTATGRPHHAVEGALVGLAAGVVIGTASGLVAGDDPEACGWFEPIESTCRGDTAGAKARLRAVLLGGAGAMVGGGIGVALDRRAEATSGVLVTPAVAPDRVGASASWRF